MSVKNTVNRRYYEIFEQLVKMMRESGGIPPTAREIVAGTTLQSTSQVNEILRQLERYGLVTMGGKGKARKITIVGASWVCPVPPRYDEWVQKQKAKNVMEELEGRGE